MSNDLPSTITPVPRTELSKAVIGAIIGTAIEWYDYYLFATAAATILNKLFFPQYDALVGTLLAYATFAIGFFVRPLGSVIFGRLGDRIGRKNTLLITIVLMGGATTLMGLLPTYAQVGIWAPILLIVLRAIQGLGSGAEYAGAVIMIIENAPSNRRGLYGSLPYIGVALGLLLSLGAFTLSSTLITGPEFDAWGWRIPFLLSLVAVVIGLILRLTLHETPVFEQLGARKKTSAPVTEVFRDYRRPLFCAWGARLGDGSLAYFYESFIIVYATQHLGMNRNVILPALMVCTCAQFVTVPFFGWLSDRFGRKPIYIVGGLLSGLLVFPFFAVMSTKSLPLIYVALLVVSAGAKTMMTAAQGAWLAEMFPAQLRYTGFALAREVTSPIAGGLAPIIATALLAYDSSSTLVGLYVVALGAITALAVWLGPETRGRDLAATSY